MTYDNTKIPVHVYRAAVRQSYRQYGKVKMYHASKFDVEDLIQECYLEIHKSNLWDSKEISLLNVVSERACLDYLRRSIKGYRQKDKLAMRMIRSAGHTEPTYNPPDYDLLITFFNYMKRVIHQKTKRRIYIVLRNHLLGIIDKYTAKRIGVSESRVYQIRDETLNRYFRDETI